jgi:rare lipoprotein A
MTPLEVALAAWIGLTPFENGVASVYSTASNGGTVVACPGEKLDNNRLVAAHKKLPCGTMVQVLNLDNGLTVDVKIIDRGPYAKGRIIDLNPAAANAISLPGLGRVLITKL